MLGDVVAELTVDEAAARVFVEGWQTWTPTTTYRLADRQIGPGDPVTWISGYGGSRARPPAGGADLRFQADGLLVIDPGTGDDVVSIGAVPGRGDDIPVIRCWQTEPSRLVITADRPCAITRTPAAGGVPAAKAHFADGYAEAAFGGRSLRPAPTIWCSWYQYFTAVTEADMIENLEAISALQLPIDVIQLDDGYQREIGDWMRLSNRFESLPGLVRRVAGHGLRTGLWIAPFLAGQRSELAAGHPGWLLRDPAGDPVVALQNWGQDVYALDAAHPGVRDYLTEVFGWLVDMGIDFFKIDFVYAAALQGCRSSGVEAVAAYRGGLDVIRAAIGPEAYLLGCGAPLLPSVGRVDAMRIGADTAPKWACEHGDWSLAGGESAELNIISRAYQHGRYWVNDPDCLLARPEVDNREQRAAVIGRFGGLLGSSDRINSLDAWGLETTRRLLSAAPPPTPLHL